ncbi:MAG: hypothetical protein BGO70_15370 [Bacteroidetes bacterium 43-93]|nr:hypothetical protein [Bacteroidota bacterium]OJX01157.1 MAG: hypothetical protein BGO70_15370 [Bacteroidetes bacterium 43-93]
MKNFLSTSLLLLLCYTASIAQNFNIQYSPSFDEPEDGWNKVMQFKNGNTFFLHFTKAGIEITVYDKARHIISTKTLESNLWEAKKMKASTIEGFYEIAGQPVIFLQQLLDRTPTLFRIILDPNTGAMVNEAKIGELQRYGFGAGYAMAFGGVDPADFYVEKDPASDCYAVINFNSFSHESDSRIEVVHYDGSHKEINRAQYDAQGFKYLRFIGMTVDADKHVYVCVYGFNTMAYGKDSRVIVSKLNVGEKAFVNKQLEYTDDFKNTTAVMQYNPGTGMIQLLTLTQRSSSSKIFSGKTTNYYLILMQNIDPETLTIISSKPLTVDKADAYAKNHLKNAKGFWGLPQQMVINSDNSTTILMEEMSQEEIRGSRGGTSYRTYLNNIGVTELDTKGTETDGYAINKVQMANGIIDPLYISKKSKGLWSFRGGMAQGWSMGIVTNNAFLSYDYLNANNKKYIIFNDYPENFEKEDTRKYKTVVAISDASTVCYELNNGKIDKFYLFGKPNDDDEANFCYIESSHFLKETNTYATLMVEKRGRKKNAKIAWVQL